jgi:hypothetical protein
MPLGLVRLNADEQKALVDWMEAGAHGPSASAQLAYEQPTIAAPIQKWETYLNQE